MTSPTPHVDARAAAVLVQVLESEPAGVSRRGLELRLNEGLEPGDLEEDSMARLVRRALSLARDLGYRIEETRLGSTARYKLAPEGSSRVLVFSPDQEALRRWIAGALDKHADKNFPPDLPSLIKQGIHAQLTFRYGSTAESIAGVAYQLDMRGDRPVILLETSSGRRAYRIDAMHEIRMTPRGALRRTGGAAPLVEADPLHGISDPRAARGRGRSSRESALLSALRIASLVRARSGEPDRSDRRHFEATTVAEKLKLSVAEVIALSELVSLVDRAVLFDEADQTFGIESLDWEATARKMDGADALNARLQLSALTSLSGAQWRLFDIDPIDESEIESYRRTLDDFLDRARIAEHHYTWAPLIIEALRECQDVRVKLDGEEGTRRLRPERLVLRHWQWIIQGKLDSSDLPQSGLALSEITYASRPAPRFAGPVV